MTPIRLFIIMMVLDTGLLLVTWISTRMVRRAYRARDLMRDKLYTATSRFAQSRESLLQSMDSMRLLQEKAEQVAEDAIADVKFKDKQIEDLCQHYKKLQTRYQDLRVSNDHLVGQYNNLLDRLPAEGEMPT